MATSTKRWVATFLAVLLAIGLIPLYGSDAAYAAAHPREISTIAGTGKSGFSGDGGAATAASFYNPNGIAADDHGNVYIADTYNYRVRKIDSSGKITTFAGSGERGRVNTTYTGPATSAALARPSGLAVDKNGNLYIADAYTSTIRKVNTDGQISTVVKDLIRPVDVAVDDAGNLFIADSAANKVYKVDKSETKTVIAGKGNRGYSGDGGPATAAQLRGPTGVAVDSNGNVFIADTGNSRIRKVDSSGTIHTVAGTGKSGYSGDGGSATSANVSHPKNISVGSDGNLYIADTESHAIRKVDASGTISTVAGTGTPGFSGDGGPAGSARLSNPLDVIRDHSGNLYILDGSLRVRRVQGVQAELNGLSLSAGTLSPVFTAGTTTYTAHVAYSVNSITVKPTLADSTSVVKVNDTAVANGTDSAPINLKPGSNPITIVVTAKDSSTQTYTVTVTRDDGFNTDLSHLSLSSGTLSPVFAGGTTRYTAIVGNSVNSITVTPTVVDAAAKVTVDGKSVASGSASGAINLEIGNNTIPVVVIAESGSTKSYTIIVTRAAPLSSNANLSALRLSNGSLSPAFAAGTTSYTASVDKYVDRITVTPTVADGAAKVTVNGKSAVSGTASGAINLKVGSNEIPIVVIAENGSTKSYTITVTRSTQSSNADLSGLRLSIGSLSPSFASGTVKYSSSVSYSYSNIKVTPVVADSKATVKVNGTAVTSGKESGSLQLNVGSNTISIVVTAENGTAKTYTVTVSRASAPNPPVVKPVINNNGTTLDPSVINTGNKFYTIETNSRDGKAYVIIPASILSEIASRNSAFYFEIKAPYGTYNIPVKLASLIPDLNSMLNRNNVNSSEISFRIMLSDKSADRSIKQAFASNLPEGWVLGSIVDFNVEVVETKTGKTIGTADEFSQSLTRIIPMPASMKSMPEYWGAFRYNGSENNFEFVAATKMQINGIWYVTIRSNTNGVYVVAQNDVVFSDVYRHWGRPYIELAAAKGLVEGVGGYRYAPEQSVTRAEFTAMLVRALGRGTTTSGTKPYNDVNTSSWYFDVIAKAKVLGLLDFVSSSSFRPNQPITREEMASMLAAVIALEKPEWIIQRAISLDNFKDIDRINIKYLSDINLVVRLGLMNGTSNTVFSPQGITTRAQAATVLVRTLQVLDMIDSY